MEVSWDRLAGRLTRLELRDLDDREFADLVSRVRRREFKRTKHRSRSLAVARKLVLRRRIKKRVPYSKIALAARYRECSILESFVPHRRKKWRILQKRKSGVVVTCENFSFLDNPVETWLTLQKIAVAECDAFDFKVDFVDSYVQDVGPFLLLGLMQERMAPVIGGGRLTAPIAKVLESVGLSKFLGMQSLDVPVDDVWPLPLRRRRSGGSSGSVSIVEEPTTFEIAADNIVARVNEWLEKIDPAEELTEYGASRIRAMIGEILNNAERHGRIGGDGEWITAGFMARRRVQLDASSLRVHICHLSLFNPGRSIASSIETGPKEITDQIAAYQHHHRSSGLTPQTLATVFALQDGISRVPQGQGMPSGGTGIMDVMEFANEVGKAHAFQLKPKVAILSGRSYIRFEAPYERGKGVPGTSRRLQWFNHDNDVRTSPDGEFVKDLPYDFPGTLITLRFVLDGHLEVDTDNGTDDD